VALIYGVDFQYLDHRQRHKLAAWQRCDVLKCQNLPVLAMSLCNCDCNSAHCRHSTDNVCKDHLLEALQVWENLHWDEERYPAVNAHTY
jgi:hypothetical protein